jgi:hypothetical protein
MAESVAFTVTLAVCGTPHADSYTSVSGLGMRPNAITSVTELPLAKVAVVAPTGEYRKLKRVL